MPLRSVRARMAVLAATALWLGLSLACGNEGGPAVGSPEATATSAPWLPVTPTAVAAARPKDVAPGPEPAVFYGADSGDQASALAVGDFNGDGVPDLALGASPAAGPQNSRPRAGEVWLFFGPFSRGEERDAVLDGPDVAIYGADAGDEAGRAVAAGDVNGDGTDDLVMGAPSADGPDNSRPDAGEVAVVFGSRALPRVIDLAGGPPDVALYGAEAEDLLGLVVDIADVSGDGAADIVFSAIWADGPDNARDRGGEVYVVFGSSSLGPVIDMAGGDADATVYGAREDDRLGESLALGDVTGDGAADLVIPATFAREAAGETYVIAGGGSMDPVIDLAQGGVARVALGFDEGDQLGHSLAVADADGDGFADVLLGAVSADGPDNRLQLAGEALLVRGSDIVRRALGGGVGGRGPRVFGVGREDRLGRAVALGDLNGDRLADLLLAAPGAAGGVGADAGDVYVFFGPAWPNEDVDLGLAAADMALTGRQPGDVLGDTVFGKPALLVADMDGDGLNDIVVSAPGGDGPDGGRADAGEAWIVFMEERQGQ